jgi:hypothetical protein
MESLLHKRPMQVQRARRRNARPHVIARSNEAKQNGTKPFETASRGGGVFPSQKDQVDGMVERQLSEALRESIDGNSHGTTTD